jgi:hypothetical protein
MTTRKNLLDRIEIASPCTANWDEMSGTDQIRYCSECRKYVYNLSEMTRREAEALLASRGNQMCARLIRDLDGTTLNVDSLPPVRLLGWKPGPVASTVVSAIISITPGAAALANGQSSSHSSQSVDASGHKTQRPAPGTLTSTITGIVSDENGAALPGAAVTLTSEASGEVLSQLTSEEGEFRFDGLAARTYIVEIRAKGYNLVKHHDVDLQQGQARRLDVAMEKLIEVMGAMGIPRQPLRTLYLESDRVVVAEVGKSTDAEREGQVKTSLSVSQTIKGDGHKPAIDIYHWAYDRDRLIKGETVLVFLQRREDARGGKDNYDLIYGATSAKHLSQSDLETYLQRLEELKAVMGNPDSEPRDITEWLMRCAEDPVTRREGAFELHMSALREQYEKEEADRRATAGEPLASTSKKPRDQEPFFSALLTSEQKQRLVNALLKSEELVVNGDSDLIKLAGRWNDPRLLPFLMSYLRRVEESAREPLWQVMETIAEVLDDKKVTALFEHYRDNESYDDLEAKQDKVENADSDEDEDANEDKTTDAKDVAADTPDLTPEAAKQVRVELLKKFLEAAESKMKLAPAK